LEPGTVLYEAEFSQFAEDVKKWKDRYIVVKNDFAVESYENKEVRYVLVTTDASNILETLTG
jgi:hypothetical protein